MPPTAKPPSKPTVAATPAKTFAIKVWSDADEGEKILEYGPTGAGKSTLAAMSPNARFIGFDDGCRKVRNAITGEAVKVVDGVQSFQDLRDALHQNNLFGEEDTIVIDTITKLEPILEPYIFRHYKVKNGTASNMRAYGWDGPAHLLDCYRLLLTDLDAHVRVGRNVILLAQQAQIRIANAEGSDYLQDGPKLFHNNQYSVRGEISEWADHVIRVGYIDMTVAASDKVGKAGKITTTDATRAIYTGGAQHFLAKSRPVNGYRIPTVIPFESESDDSLWQYIFDGARAA